jgi:hypothetical protein
MRHNPLRRLREVPVLCFSLLISAQMLAAQSPKPTHGRADQPANLRLPEVHCATNFSVTCELTARSTRHLTAAQWRAVHFSVFCSQSTSDFLYHSNSG